MLKYSEKFRLISSKETHWLIPSLREFKAASVILGQLQNDLDKKSPVTYSANSREIDLTELSVLRAWLIPSNATSVNLRQLSIMKIFIIKSVYEEKLRLIFWREVRGWRAWLSSCNAQSVTSAQLQIHEKMFYLHNTY